MKLFTLFLVAFIMNACYSPAEDTDSMAKKSWSQSGPLTPKNRNQAVTLQANFEDDPGSYTVQFSVDGPDQGLAIGTRKTVADIIWSVEGNSVSRQIDVVNGTSISGTAQGVSVKVRDNSSGAIVDVYNVSVQVVKGQRSSTQQPPYLSAGRFSTDNAITTTSVPVPQSAGAISVLVLVSPLAVGTAIPEFSVRTQVNSGSGALAQWDPRDDGWVPLSSGATSLSLEQDSTLGTVLWSVFFGIDG